MKSVRILDCTLRDGGFVNNWNFGYGSIKSIVSRLDKSGVDFVEVGFIDQRQSYNQDRTILPTSKDFDPILKDLYLKKSMVVGMVDFGTCSLDRISEKKDSCLDGIRVIFKKADQDSALNYLAEIKEKGYKIFVQPVSITGYSDDEVISLAKKINSISPFAVSIVDTYGLMHNEELMHYFKLFDACLDLDISIGYHSHNNFQLAYSNSINLMDFESDRDLVVDGSLYGMGKGAGNANTELLAMYCNENLGADYSIDQMLEAIDVDVLKEFQKNKWGYSLLYYVSALNDCHPDYVKYLIGKKSLSMKSVNQILLSIPESKKLSFDKVMIEGMYQDYQNVSCDDVQSYIDLRKGVAGKSVLLLGPGVSIFDKKDEILEYISSVSPVVFSINFINEFFSIDYVFMGNPKRYSQFFHRIYGDDSGSKVICTSNISSSSKKIDIVFSYGSLVLEEEAVRDNPLLMLLKILDKCDISDVVLAGFDGYGERTDENYYAEYIPLLYCSDDVMKRNSEISRFISSLSQNLAISSLTKTRYF